MKNKAYRHGEIAILKTKEIPKGLKPSKKKVFMKGSHGHNHSIDNGRLYFTEDEIIFGYLEAKNTSLLHSEHSPKVGDAKIEDGYYKLIKQVEHTPEGLKPVID